MPIDPSKALGAEIPEGRSQWTSTDVILYHLGIGAGVPPTDERELRYTYESNLVTLPSFAVCPVFGTLGGLMAVPGMEFNLAMLLHGEQDLEIHRPIPTEAKAVHTGKVTDIWDKGKGAVVVVEAKSTDDSGQPLFTNRFTSFIRGEGGFGGDSGPKPGNEPPARDPDRVVESATLPQQALLYRLSGDRNPLHADPSFAAMGGFEKPILHGLCTYGIVCKAVVDNELDGDVTKVARYQVRFKGVVYPGETIVTQMWREGDKILIQASTRERGEAAITNAAITVN